MLPKISALIAGSKLLDVITCGPLLQDEYCLANLGSTILYFVLKMVLNR